MCKALIDLINSWYKPQPPVEPPIILPTKDLCMIAYIWMDETVVSAILKVKPKYLVANNIIQAAQSSIGIQKFTAAGIKYFEYIDGGYESVDLVSILSDIDKVAAAGAYGIFIDQVSSEPAPDQLTFISNIYHKAQEHNLKVVLNVGVANWSDGLMDYCTFMQSTENWNGQNLSDSQLKWKERVWLLTEGCTLSNTASNLTLAAWNRGIAAHYACESYVALPSWLDSYIANLEPDAPPTIPHPEEPPNYAQTPTNTNIAMFVDKWLTDWAVPDKYHLGWKLTLDFIIDNSFPYPAGVWGTSDGIIHGKFQSPYVNTGVVAHEGGGHGSYAKLTEDEKLEFESTYVPLLNDDNPETQTIMELLWTVNSYMHTSAVEAHAEVYRYLGQFMPEELKQFYPNLF
jgi:hypothetical protein